jgi:hypothetical protein
LPNGDIIPGVRIAVPKGPNAEQEVLARIDDKFGAESVVRSISKAMKPSDNSNDRDYGIDTTSKMESADAKPDYIDLDKDGDEEESMRKAASDMNESFISKLKKNLIGGALRK